MLVQIDDGKVVQSPLLPIRSKMGDFIIPRTVTAYQDDGGVFTDYTTAANNTTVGDVNLMPALEAVNDAFYFGLGSPFGQLRIVISTAGVGSAITWEYYNGSTWAALTPIDDTSGFTVLGTNPVTKAPPTNWAKTTVNGSNLYWWRARVSTASYTVTPIATQIFVSDIRQTISGLGFKPLVVIFFANQESSGISFGFDDGVNSLVMANNHAASANTWTGTSTISIEIIEGATASALANIVSKTNDAFSVITYTSGVTLPTNIHAYYVALGS